MTGSVVEADIPAGGCLLIESSGEASTLTRGFARVDSINRQPVGATAHLRRQTAAGTQSIVVPLSPELELRSVIPVRLDVLSGLELVWVSGNSSTVLDVVFRDGDGRTVHKEALTFGGDAQVFVRVLERWPQLAGLRGTLEWRVSFPGADIYEDLVLAGLALAASAGGDVAVLHGMTLPAHQARSSQH